MKPGDIVLLPFPQANLKVGKLRPALIIATIPGHHADLLIALMTSRTHLTVPEFDEVIDPSDRDFSKTGLKVRSVVRLGRLTSVHPSVIDSHIGYVSSKRLRQIKERIADWMQENYK